MGAENEGSTPAIINHDIYTILMFYKTEFPMTCRDRDKSALNWDIPPGNTYALKFGYLLSTKDNVFTVTNTLGTFTVLAKMYQFLVAYVAAFVSSASDVLQHLSLAVRSDQTHSLLSPVPSHSQVLSLRAKFIME